MKFNSPLFGDHTNTLIAKNRDKVPRNNQAIIYYPAKQAMIIRQCKEKIPESANHNPLLEKQRYSFIALVEVKEKK